MKKLITLSLLLLLFCIVQSNAQCTANGSAFGNNTSIPSYNVSGMVSVVLNSNNTVTLNMGSNFATASGPDVRVFLVDRGTLTNAQLKVTSNFLARPRIEMGLINGNGTASFTKTIPSGMNISNFNTIYFYCQAFNQFWDFGSYTAFSSGNCETLNTDNFVANRFKVYPNPSKGSIYIDFDELVEVKSVNLFSSLGQKVFFLNEGILSNAAINISELKTGIYFMQLTDKENNTVVKKISVEN
jgi:hypothetical protein